MKFVTPLIAVSDLKKSKDFYKRVLGLEVVLDFGANVTLMGGVALQTLETWKEFIDKSDQEVAFGSNASELYFEEDDFDSFAQKLEDINGIDYVHPVIEHSWGQRVVRFYDPDRHIIEVGEDMGSVVGRFLKGGMSVEETAKRMDVSVDYIESCMK